MEVCGFTMASMVSLMPSFPDMESLRSNLHTSYSLEVRDLNLGWSWAIPSFARHSAMTDFNIVLFFCDLDGLERAPWLLATPELHGLTSSVGFGCLSVGVDEMFSVDLEFRCSILAAPLVLGKLVRLLLRSRHEDAFHFPLPARISEWLDPVLGNLDSLLRTALDL